MTADIFHVMPIGDLIAHQADEDCVCGPAAQLVRRPLSGDVWLHVHHSLDGREARERCA